MSLSHLTRAERLETFQRAMRDGVSMDEARRRIARDTEERLRVKAKARACGTHAPVLPSDSGNMPDVRPEPYWKRW